MKKFFLLLLFGFTLVVAAQNEQLAQNYFDRGEFEKALISYQELLKSQTANFNYFEKTIECYQQLSQFDKAEVALNERYAKFKQGNLLVQIGFNYQLQKDQNKANKFYEEAIDRIKKTPNEVYSIAYVFEKKGLIDYAIRSYELAIEKEPKFNFNFQMALEILI
jgi:tetratricopeptide (TPR) repeat protein